MVNPAIDYNAAGQLKAATYGNGVQGAFTYNDHLQLATLRYYKPGAGSDVLNLGLRNEEATSDCGIREAGFAGDGGPAQIALLRFPRGVATLSNGDILIADSGNCRLRLVDHRNSTIRTIVGTGNCSSSGDGGQAYKASMAPDHIAVDRADNIYMVESGADRVRRIAPNGIIMTFRGQWKTGIQRR
ncbi:MAG: hypothetical protein ACRD72_25815 [Candidatus Angelobacter sp.]